MTGASAWYRWDGADLLLRVRVSPRARTSSISGADADCLRVRVAAPPLDGRANDALLAYLAGLFELPASRARLDHGAGGRVKLVRLQRPPRPARALPPPLQSVYI